MSKGSKHRKGVVNNVPIQTEPRLDYLAIVPAVFMCLLTLIILLMDITISGMASEQYQDYPSLFRLTHIGILFAGILFWVIYLIQNGITYLSPKSVLHWDKLYVLFFAIFFLFIIVSTLINGVNEKAIHGVSFRNIGVFHIFAFFLIYCFLSSKIHRQRFRTGVVVMYMLLADSVGVAAIVDRFFIPIDSFGAKKELSTIFFNGNHYGYFLTMAVLVSAGLFIYHSNNGLRLVGLISVAVNGFVLLLNNSFGCILSVIIVFVLFFLISLFTNRSVISSFLLLIVCTLIIGIIGSLATGGITDNFQSLLEDVRQVAIGGDNANSAGHNRWLLWTWTFDYILQRPVLGYGCEGISDMIMADTGRGNPHNELLGYAAFFGIPAAIAYMLGVLAVFMKNLRSSFLHDPASAASGMAAMGYFVSSLFGVPMFYTTPFFFIFMGMSIEQDK